MRMGGSCFYLLSAVRYFLRIFFAGCRCVKQKFWYDEKPLVWKGVSL